MANFSISLSRVPNIPNEFSALRPKNIVLRDYSNLAPIRFLFGEYDRKGI